MDSWKDRYIARQTYVHTYKLLVSLPVSQCSRGMGEKKMNGDNRKFCIDYQSNPDLMVLTLSILE